MVLLSVLFAPGRGMLDAGKATNSPNVPLTLTVLVEGSLSRKINVVKSTHWFKSFCVENKMLKFYQCEVLTE